MIITKQVFFECDNPDCRLRFPGNEGYARSRRCPVCRSSIHAAAPVENISEKDKYSDNNSVQLAGRLKSRGYILWALEDLPGAIPLFQMEAGTENYPIVLILGNEVAGVDPGIIDLCSQVVSIPMLGQKQSYNVTVAFGIAASFILYRQIVSQEFLKIVTNT